jgi:hypothetical protein
MDFLATAGMSSATGTEDDAILLMSEKEVGREEDERKRLMSERDVMQMEKEKLERDAKERNDALEKERKEKEDLMLRVAQLEQMLKTQLQSTPPPAPAPASPASPPPTFVFSSVPNSEGIVNRDEAFKCLNIAKKAFADGDLAKAEKFVLKAQGMYKCPEVTELLDKIMASKPAPPSLGENSMSFI